MKQQTSPVDFRLLFLIIYLFILTEVDDSK